MKFRWSLFPPQPVLAGTLARQLAISPLLAQCLLNRQIDEPEIISHFLQPRLKRLADPFSLPNMELAVARLFQAREQQEPLVIFGDYDVDGVSSTALLVEILRALGWSVNYFLPDRMDEGYGLSESGVEKCLEKFPVNLLLAVDCGSTAVETISRLRARGIDVIVVDHHQLSDPLPPAVALVNPKLAAAPEGKPAPGSELCAAGLAFKLAHALVKEGRRRGIAAANDFDLRSLLDLVALATVADLVPVTGENRIFVAAGLRGLESTTRPGLIALKEVAQVKSPIGGHEIGFQLGPRLNAAGRLENALAALELLLAPDLAQAEPLARELDARNRERQQIERGICEQVSGAVRARFNAATDFVIVEGQLLWHIGVVGIVAARVLREFYRPTIILGGDGDAWRGSGRSIEGFDLAAALRECDDLLLRHGGHAMAAGVTIHPDRIEAFRCRLNELARRALRPDQLQPPLKLDATVELAELNLERMGELALLEPCGQGNPPIQLAARHLKVQGAWRTMGKEQQHLKFRVTDGRTACDAIWWNGAAGSRPEGGFDLAFVPQVNEYKGSRTIQLKVLDWRPAV